MEIVVRATFVFVFLWFITRVTGRSTLGELSTFQLLLYVTMGDLVQQGVTQQDYSVTSAVLAVGVFSLLTVALSLINSRWRRVRPITTGVPLVIVDEGEPVLSNLRTERISIDDLMSAAREQGVERFADIRVAVLETNGRISFFTRSHAADGAPETPSAT
ncbi:MAG: DUF421 domain-containing protein [Pseudonocardiales bacterium]|nr:MAG: DUF421 domain-containing protein [Pseudonocardiales bacterium]